MSTCVLCGGVNCNQKSTDQDNNTQINCIKGYSCSIQNSILKCQDREKRMKMLTMIVLFIQNNKKIHMNGNDLLYQFYYEEENSILEVPSLPQKVNVFSLLKNYPETFIDKMDMVLINLSKKYHDFGEIIAVNNNVDKILLYNLYCLKDSVPEQEINGTLNREVELGYLKKSDVGFQITANGWIRISELQKKEKEINQGFIAMAFGEETNEISNVFKRVIEIKCGYVARRIDEKEHNNQIVPEILFEIERSKFVVVDVTFPNHGAYYEAGYAEALGKEVIICCREIEFKGENKPHFDISQKSTVVWKDERDLEERLFRRIEATVGLNI